MKKLSVRILSLLLAGLMTGQLAVTGFSAGTEQEITVEELIASASDTGEAEITLLPPELSVYQVEDLADTEAKAPIIDMQTLYVKWADVSGAEYYSISLAEKSGGEWITVEEETELVDIEYSFRKSCFASAQEKQTVYRIGAASHNADGRSETVYYYFAVAVPPEVEESILVNGAAEVRWDSGSGFEVSNTFTITSEFEWNIECTYDWIEAIDYNGELIVTLKHNSATKRQGFITVSNGYNTAEITVNQAASLTAPQLIYPILSTDSNNPTEYPVGGMYFEVDKGGIYNHARIFELDEYGNWVDVFNTSVNTSGYNDWFEVPADYINANEQYRVTLYTCYSKNFLEYEIADQQLTASWYFTATETGHHISLNGRSSVEYAEGDTIMLFSSNLWDWETDADWINIKRWHTENYNHCNGKISVSVSENTENIDRSGIVTFSNGYASATLLITQNSVDQQPRFIFPANVSQDFNNPTVFPYDEFYEVVWEADSRYEYYEDGQWIDTGMGADSDYGLKVHNYSKGTITSSFMEDIIYRFTVINGEYETQYYFKFSSAQTLKYVQVTDASSFSSSNRRDYVEVCMPASGGSDQILLRANTNWTVTSDSSWLTVSSSSGSSTTKKTLTISTSKNTTGKERIGTLSFKISGTVYAQVCVTQAIDDNLVAYFEYSDNSNIKLYDFSTDFKNLDGSSNSQVLAVVSDDNYSIQCNDEWITIDDESAAEDLKPFKKITIDLAAHTDGEIARTGSVTIMYGNVSQTVYFTQEPKMDAVTLVSPSLSDDDENPTTRTHGDLTVTWKSVDNAVKYRVLVSPEDDSIKIKNFYSFDEYVYADGSNQYSITIPAKALSLEGIDEVSIIPFNTYAHTIRTYFYIQNTTSEGAYIGGTREPIWDRITDLASSRDFLVQSTSDWTAQAMQSWITLSTDGGISGDALTVTVAENTGAARTGQVNITVGSSVTVLTVEQCAKLTDHPQILTPDIGTYYEPLAVLSADMQELTVTWHFEPQVNYYSLRIDGRGIDTETYIQSEKLYTEDMTEGSYTFDLSDVNLIPGARYLLVLSRHFSGRDTSTVMNREDRYFTVSDGSETLEIDGELQPEMAYDEDWYSYTINSSGDWYAYTTDDWILLDEYDVNQKTLDEEGYTSADYAAYSGQPGEQLCISALTNTGEERTGSVIIQCGAVTETITVIQEEYFVISSLISPELSTSRYKPTLIPYDDIVLYLSEPDGGENTCTIKLWEGDAPADCDTVVFKLNDIDPSSQQTIPVDVLTEGKYYELEIISVSTSGDQYSPSYYFRVNFKDALSLNMDTVWKEEKVSITAQASGGDGDYVYYYDLYLNGERINSSMPDGYTTYYTFPLDEPGEYQVIGVVYDGMGTVVKAYSDTYTVSDTADESAPPAVTWNSAAQTLAQGDTFSFSGTAQSAAGIDKLHVTIGKTGDHSIDYFRREGLNATSFDLSEIPSFTVGDVLTGLMVTNEESSLDTSGAGEYVITIWVTDVNGGSNGGIQKLLTVTKDMAPPVVDALTASDSGDGSVVLSARIAESSGSVIADYGFNLYTSADGTAPSKVYSKDSGAALNSYNMNFSAEVTDIAPGETWYIEAYASVYEGSTEYKGTSGRIAYTKAAADTGTETTASDIVIQSPAENGVIELNGTASVYGYLTNMSYGNVLVYLYDRNMTELERASANRQMSSEYYVINFDSVEFSFSGRNPGLYYIVVEAWAGGVAYRNTVSVVHAGGILVEQNPVSGVTMTGAALSAELDDYADKTLTNYGFNVYTSPSAKTPAAVYSAVYDRGAGVEFSSGSGALTASPKDLAGNTTYYAEAFASYSLNGTEIVSTSSTREAFTTKSIEITLTSPARNMTLNAASVKIGGTLKQASGVTASGPVITVTDASGSVVETVNASLSGTAYSHSLDMTGYGSGKYSIAVTASSSTGETVSAPVRTITVPRKLEGLGFIDCTNETITDVIEELTIGVGYSVTVKAAAEPSSAVISRVEWEISDSSGISVKAGINDEGNTEKYLYQIDALKAGQYTVTAAAYNYDGTSVSTTFNITVKVITSFIAINGNTKKVVPGVYVWLYQNGVCINPTDPSGANSYLAYAANDMGQIFVDNILADGEYTVKIAGNSGAETYIMQDAAVQVEAGGAHQFMIYDMADEIISARFSAAFLNEETDEYVVTAKDTDILNGSVHTLDQSDETYHTEIDLVCPYDNVQEYYLIQDGKTIASSTDGHFSLNISKYTADKTVYAQVKYGGKLSTKYPLQLRITKDTFRIEKGASSGSITIGKELKVVIPENIFALGGSEISVHLTDIPVSAEFTDDSIKIAVGVLDLFKDSKDADDPISQSEANALAFAEFKDFAVDVSEMGWGNALDYHKARKSDQLLDSLNKDFAAEKEGTGFFKFFKDVELIGSIEVNKATRRIEGILKFSFKVNLFKDQYWQHYWGVVPIGISLTDLNPELEGQLSTMVSLQAEDITQAIVQQVLDHLAGKFRLSWGASVGVGPGFKHCNVQGVVRPQLDAEIQVPSTLYDIDLSLSGFIKAKFFAFEYSYEIGKMQLNLAEGQVSSSTPYSLRSVDLSDTSLYTLADRSYLDGAGGWYEKPESSVYALNSGIDSLNDITTLMNGVYPDARISVVQTDDVKVMVWLADDTNRLAVNRAKLVYSVFDELTGKWSAPLAVDDDGTLDSYPSLKTDGERIFLAWTDMKTVLDNSASLDDTAVYSEICTAEFSTKTMSFINVSTLTSNELVDIAPCLSVQDGKMAVIWVRNDSGNVWGLEGINTVLMSEYTGSGWTAPEELISKWTSMVSMDIGTLDGVSCMAYSKDKDSDLNTTDDRSLHLLNLETGEEITLDASGSASGIRFAEVSGTEMLIWVDNGVLYGITCAGDEIREISAAGGYSSEYRILTGDDGTVLLESVVGDDGSVLYISRYDEEAGQFLGRIPAAAPGMGYIFNYDGVMLTDHNMMIVFTAEDGSATQLCSAVLTPVSDLVLNSVVCHQEDAMSGIVVNAFAEVSNMGFDTAEQILFRMYDGEEQLHEWYEDAEIKSGETVQIDIGLPVPVSEEQKNYTVTAEAVDCEDADPDNNSTEITFGSTDLSVEADEILTGSGGLMKITVTNHGGYASDAVIGIYRDEALTDLIDTVDAGTVEKKSLVAVNYPTDDLPEIVYLQVEGSREELYDHNNGCMFLRSAEIVKQYSVSGSVTSYGSETDEVLIQLIPEGAEEALYYTTVAGNEKEYVITGVNPGRYTLRVSKNNHVTREYAVEIGG